MKDSNHIPNKSSSYRRVLVTSGPTRGYIDRIRYVANSSSGKLGSRIIEALVSQGIPVIHLHGCGSEYPNVNDNLLLETIEVETVNDLINSVKRVSLRGDICAVVHAMAVLDYVPESTLKDKKPSGDTFWDIRLKRTQKVISIIRELMPDAYTVGFKLETDVTEEELVKRACVLLTKNNLDLVVANDLERVSGDYHKAVIVGPENTIVARTDTKEKIAELITEFILENQ